LLAKKSLALSSFCKGGPIISFPAPPVPLLEIRSADANSGEKMQYTVGKTAKYI
jgi:hypothetical protein